MPISLSLLLIAGSLSGPPLGLASNPGQDAGTLVLQNVHIACPTSSEVQPDCRVTIEHGAIVRVEPMSDSASPKGASVLDGRGRFLVPGFYDMHTHLPGVDSALPAPFRHQALRMMLEAGITTARVARGAPELLADKRAIARGELPGPRLFVATPPLARNRFPALEDALELFAIWKAQGYDAAKFLSGPPAAEHAAHARAAVDAGLRWYGHLPAGPVIDWPLESMASLEHASALERLAALFPDTLDQDLSLLAKNKIFICPDIDWYFALSDLEEVEVLLARDGMDLLPAGVVRGWTEQRALPNPRRKNYGATVDAFRKLVPRLRNANVQLLISPSDAPFSVPGKSYVIEAEHLVEAGYTPHEVLQMATIHAAACQGEELQRGSVQPGRVADLVLLDSNPLNDAAALGEVSCVLVRGKVVVGR